MKNRAVAMSDELWGRIHETAGQEGITASAWIREALEVALAAPESKPEEDIQGPVETEKPQVGAYISPVYTVEESPEEESGRRCPLGRCTGRVIVREEEGDMVARCSRTGCRYVEAVTF